MDAINTEIRSKAIMFGLCQEWQDGWSYNLTKQELINKYKKGARFVCQHNFPSIDYIEENFDKSLLHENGLFVNEHICLENKNGFIATHGKCTGSIKFNKMIAAAIYLRHDSDITIEVGGVSTIFVEMYDNAKVKIIQSGMGKVYVRKNSENITVDSIGTILLRG